VPKVYCAFIHEKRAYIVMERIRGKDLPTVWNKLCEDGKKKMFMQLRQMMDEMRALKHSPAGGVESCVGGSLFHSSVVRPGPRFGPFKTIQEFRRALREDFNPPSKPDRLTDEEWQELQDMIKLQEGPWPPSVFSHGDLNPSNIFMRGDKIVGIIDWETAGWFPHYWEYTAAWWGNDTRTGWQEDVVKFLDQFPRELEMERIRRRWWGDF
jgi:aminoglycoside phosphotransferase (APT) family kinase protein